MSYETQDILIHILLEIEYLMENITISEDKFMYDETTKRAFVRSLEVIGEAVKKLPDDLKEKYPEILWHEIAAMRNRLIHDYFGVDYMIVWETVKNEIPTLHIQIEQIKKDLNSSKK